MRHRIRPLLRCAIACAVELGRAGDAQAQNGSMPFLDRLDREVPALLARHEEPGAAVVYVEGCQGYVRTYGVARRAPPAPLRADSVFDLGSISKTFSAWAVMTLVEAGKVRLDDPVDLYLDRWHLPESTFDRGTVTVRRLLNHTAGTNA